MGLFDHLIPGSDNEYTGLFDDLTPESRAPRTGAFNPGDDQPIQAPRDEPVPQFTSRGFGVGRKSTEDPNVTIARQMGESVDTRTVEPAPFARAPLAAPETVGETASRLGKRTARGLTESLIASVPEAISMMGRDIVKQRYASAVSAFNARLQERKDLMASIEENGTDSAIGRAASMRLKLVEGELIRAARMTAEDSGLLDTPIEETGTFKAGEVIRKGSEGIFGRPPERDETLSGMLAEGAGNMVGFVTVGTVGSILGGPALSTLAVASSGAALNSSAIYKEARAAGADEETALRAARLAGLVGSSEVVPIVGAVKLLPPKLRGQVSSALFRRLITVAENAGEEAAQEALAGIANNFIAQGIFDPERGWSEDVGEQALVGGILGAILGGGRAVVEKYPAAPDPRGPSGSRTGPAPLPTPAAPREDKERLESPRLTEADRASPIPNDVIDDGKAILDAVVAGEPLPKRAPEVEAKPGGKRVEIIDEVETDENGETTETGRKIELDLDTGTTRVIESDQADEAAAPAEAPVVNPTPFPKPKRPAPPPPADTGNAQVDAALDAIAAARSEDSRFKKPLIEKLRTNHQVADQQGQTGENLTINPAGEVAAILKARGITNRSAPGLFSAVGRERFDNLPADEWESQFPGIMEATATEPGENYLNEQGLIDLIVRDVEGDPSWLRTRQEVQRQEAELDAALERGIDDDLPPDLDYEPYDAPILIPPLSQDISTPSERSSQIIKHVDATLAETGMTDILTPDEKRFIFDTLEAKGGNAEDILGAIIRRSADRAKARTEEAADDIPLFDEDGQDREGRGREDADGNEADTGVDEKQPEAEGGRRADAEDAGRAGEGEAGQDRGVTETTKTEKTEAGQQTLIPGVEPVTDKARAEAAAAKPKRGGNAPLQEDGLFGDPGNRVDLFDTPTAKDVREAAKDADRNPTDAQKEAGNYQMGHISWNGLDITIENAKGSMRRGKDSDGEEWSVKMPAHYGYIKRTEGADGEHVDVYMGDSPESVSVWIVDQVNLPDKSFDEHKVLLGFETKTEALAAYDAGFSDGKGPARRGGLAFMTVSGFKEWLANGSQKVEASETKAKTKKKPAAKKSARWVIREIATGEPIMETTDQKKVDALKTDRFEAVPIGEHLAQLNDPTTKAAQWARRDVRETIDVSNDTFIGENSDGEKLYDRANGDRYRMRFDRADKPNGYPDFGGDLAPVATPKPAKVAKTAKKPTFKKPNTKLLNADEQAKLDDILGKLDDKFKNQLSAGLDPEIVSLAVQAAEIYVKAGVRRFRDYALNLADRLGLPISTIGRYARIAYNDIRDEMESTGQPVADMDDSRSVIAELARLNQEEKDASGAGEDLERDSGDTTAPDELGEADVPPATRRDGQGADEGRGATDGSGGQRQGGGRVSGGNASRVGSPRDQAIPDGKRPDRQPADDRDRAGSRVGSEQGLPADRGGATDLAGHARDGADLKGRARQQAAADKIKVIPGDEANIRATLPLLTPEQQDDIVAIEARFAKPDGHGMLITNGTGTGKTYTGGGTIKRFVQQGKDNILVAAPSQGILDHWLAALEDLGVPASKLEDTKDAGEGVVLTTYANLDQNPAIMKRAWDLVVTDEAHKLSQNAAGDATGALDAVRAMTNRPADVWRRSQALHADQWEKYRKMPDGQPRDNEFARLKALADRETADFQKIPRSKVLFLSATPFAYDKSVDYAEGYLFDYPSGGVTDTGSRQGGREFFFVENFGYRIRYHKLTKPEAAVDNGVFERQLHEKLRAQGVLSGRQLDIDADYDRKFAVVADRQGERIDEAMKLMWDRSRGKTDMAKAYGKLSDHVRKNFNYLKRMQLLEAIKAKAAIPDIKKHLALGRKVVVFHDYNVGGGFNPFTTSTKTPMDEQALTAYRDLVAQNPWVADLNFSGYKPPVGALTEAFGDQAVVYNGTISTKERKADKEAFNTDGSGKDVIIVQSAAGEAGIDLHDTTDGHQRVLINLGMPTRPTTTLQAEGRIRRVGAVSDAVYRYYTIGTTWERQAFADRIAAQSSTVENLALGDRARRIRDSFIDAYTEAEPLTPSKSDGKGGRERDRAENHTSPYDEAKTHYYGRMKTAGRRDQRKGIDFYPTPEPLGFKMVEWAQIRTYEKALEPSVGDGSIARYFPADADRTIIDPSNELLSRAQLRTPGAKAIDTMFEDHHIVNKYDAIVMNPPFGMGGKTAMDHVEKALGHLRPGGRLVALIPTGPSADKRFNKMLEELDPHFVVSGNVSLPPVTFEKAGTKIMANVVIFDRMDSAEARENQQTKNVNMTGSDTIEQFFDRLEGIAGPDRPAPVGLPGAEAEMDGGEAAPEATQEVRPGVGSSAFTTAETVHAKTGDDLWVATIKDRVDREKYMEILTVAKAHNGWYSSYKAKGAIPGFQFKSEADRAAFIQDMEKPVITKQQTQPSAMQMFYSPLLNAVEGAKQKQASPGDWKAILSKLPGVKKAELEWLGVEEWLDMQQGQVPREALADFVRMNQIEIVESRLAGDDAFDSDNYTVDVDYNNEIETGVFAADVSDDASGEYLFSGTFVDEEGVYYFPEIGRGSMDGDDVKRLTAEKMQDRSGISGPAQFEDYTEEGGTNYREILLRMPGLHETGKNKGADSPLTPQLERIKRRIDAGLADESEANFYRRATGDVSKDTLQKRPFVQSSHFEQENIVVHARVKDREDGDGKRVLFVEEIQSDLASKWREATESPEVTARRRELDREDAHIMAAIDLVKHKQRPIIRSVLERDEFAQTLNPETASLLAAKIINQGMFEIERRPLWLKAYEAVVSQPGYDSLIRDRTQLDRDREANRQARLALGTERTLDPSLPDTPFKEENTYILMVKRLLREAAEKGYDKLAWTPGYMQAERWNNAAQSVVEGVDWKPAPENQRDNGATRLINLKMADRGGFVLWTDTAGMIVDTSEPISAARGKPLSSLIGPTLAQQVLSDDTGSVSGQKITFPDSGYAIAYDQQIKRAVDKFAKKHGSRVVEDKSLPDFDSLNETTKRLMVSYKERAEIEGALSQAGVDVGRLFHPDKVKSQIGTLKSWDKDHTENDAIRAIVVREVSNNEFRKAFGTDRRNPVWSIDITPELRAAAMEPMPVLQKPSHSLNATAMNRAQAGQIMPALRKALDRMMLKNVRLGMNFTAQETQGMFFVNRLGQMDILIGMSLDPFATVYHEAIHAMRVMNLFTAREWATLSDQAVKTWIKKYDIQARYPDLMPSEQIEEAIAEAYGEWASSKQRSQSESAGIFAKIARLFKAFRDALNGQGFQTAEDVFGAAFSGQIGKRHAGNTGVMQAMAGQEAMQKEQRMRLPSRTARAMGPSPHIPDRRIWEELRASNASYWSRIGQGAAAAHDWVDKGRIYIQDRFLPVLRSQGAIEAATGAVLPEEQNAYLAEETFSGKVGRHLFEIDEQYVKPIIEIIAETKGDLTMDDVGTWLTARHAEERNIKIASINPSMPDGGSGMMTVDAHLVLADAAAGPHAARYDAIGKLVDDLRERTLDMRTQSGLMTADDADIWRKMYDHYVPLKGFAETDHSDGMLDMTGVGRRFNVKGPETRRAMGRTSEAFNPLQAVITQAQEVAIRSEKNRVGQALYELAKNNPAPAMWKIKTPKMKRVYNRTTGLVEWRVEDPVSLFMDPNEMAVKVNGKEHRILFMDPRLARAAGSVGADQMNWFIRIMSVFARYFSATNTMLDPEFVIRNAVRDMQAAQINIQNFGKDDANKLAAAMIKNWPKAFVGAYRGQLAKEDSDWTRYYKEFEQSGAKVSFWKMEQPEAGAKDLKKRIRMASGGLAGASRFVKISTRDNPVLGFIERTNLAVDNAVRLAAYVEARRLGWSKMQAASLSKNLTVNFNRRGEWGATINAFYPFANAGIQGTQILFRAMTSKKMAKYAIGLLALGAILDQVNASLSEEDDDNELAYDKIPDWKNRINLVVMLGPDAGNAASIWMPYGYSLFPYAGQQMSKVIRGVKDPGDAMADFAAAVFGSFSPMQGGDLQAVLTPTMLDPINEMAANEDWLGRPIRPENAYSDFGPDAYKFYGGASEASKATSDALNRVTGGNRAEPGLIDVSPEYLDHMFGFVTGGAGRFVGRVGDTATKIMTGEDVELSRAPFGRAVYLDTGIWLDRDRYYRFREQVQTAVDAVKTESETGDRASARSHDLAKLDDALKATEKAMRKKRSQRKTLASNTVLKKAERKGLVDAVAKSEHQLYLSFNRKFVDIMGPQGE